MTGSTYSVYILPLLCLVPFVTPGVSRADPAVNIKVKLEGVDGIHRDNILSYLSIDDYTGEAKLSESELKRLHRNAPDQIKQALKPLGYYEATVNSSLTRSDERWIAEYQVEKGTPVRLKSIDVELKGEGRSFGPFRRLVESVPFSEGDVLHQGKYTNFKTKFRQIANRWGFFDGEFRRSEITINLSDHEASIHLVYWTGPRYDFGEITFRQDALNDTFLRQFLIFEPGDPYNRKSILEQEEIFIDSNYFRNVEIKTPTDETETDRVPVRVETSPRKRYNFNAGMGFGTNTGPRLRFNYENRRVNRRGHRWGVKTLFSSVESEVSARYTLPYGDPRSETLKFLTAFTDENPEPSESRLGRFATIRSTRYGSWLATYSMELRQENFEIADQDASSTLLVPSVTVSRTRSNDPFFPTRGLYLSGKLQGSGGVLESEAPFLRATLTGQYIRPFFSEFRVLLRGKLGTSIVSSIRRLPPTLRFFAGGEGSIRGYSYQSQGPENSSGDVIGGEHLLIGSVEVDRRFYENWYLAVFYDVGNALRDPGDIDRARRRGTGVGIRWSSPFGPIRLDVAQALDQPGNPIRIHFAMGRRL